MKIIFFIAGLLLLLLLEILRVYFIMPFPGSQQQDTIDLAYWLHNNIWWLRIAGLLLVAWLAAALYRQKGRWTKFLLPAAAMIYLVVFYLFNFRFLADKMFYQPGIKTFVEISANTIPMEKLVIGIELNGEAKAYPIQLIGYHHQVEDTLGGHPLMVTYCTVCRTGRVFSPLVHGKKEQFRLVGMDQFNAMFEDSGTKSWWQQSTGIAITGPLKGSRLEEYPSEQMGLAAWMRLHPNSRILQPDSGFSEKYLQLDKYDKGTGKSALTRRDTASWKPKSWVVGIATATASRAIDWNELLEKKLLMDSLPGLPLLVFLEKDSVSFHVWNRDIKGMRLRFEQVPDQPDAIRDIQTQSVWNADGTCIEGALQGARLQPIQAYQEFWHSWQSFHPSGTTRRVAPDG